MKIVAGLGCIDDYIRFVEAGADEFFCGYVPYEWTKRYGVMLPLNRREVLYYNVQMGSITDLKILSKMVDQYKVPIKITLNSLYYTREQYPLLLKIITDCMSVGFDTFIIADIALILYLRQHKIKCKIHLSGEAAEVNRLMIQKMNDFEISRYIFHRKNSIQDMKNCIQYNPVLGLEYEAFALNEWCHYTGGFCNSLHCDELTHICKVPYQFARLQLNDRVNEFKIKSCSTMDEQQGDLEYLTGSTGCGLCALKEMKEAGITHLKLVGRGNYTNYMEQDIKQMRKAIQIIDESQDVNEYKQRIRNELFANQCSGVCYYR